MKKVLMESLEVPAGISCSIEHKSLKVSKSGVTLTREINLPKIHVTLKDNKIVFESKKGSKREFNVIKSYIAHIGNLFSGLDKEYTYNLEACNVHFPMTLKVDKDKLIINNFLGEKTPRHANILPHVKVVVAGPKVTVSSHDKESAGQTAANIEKATHVRNRDRRVFQDGIFLVERGVQK